MYKVETEFKHEDLTCVVIFTDMGHRCGYVAVEKDSPLYEVKYNKDLKKPELLAELKQTSINKRGIVSVFCWDGESVSPGLLFNVHGGITYSGGTPGYPIESDKKLWWFGFDCAHLGDGKDIRLISKYFPESDINRYSDWPSSGTIKSLDYVKHECMNLAEQIKCVESTY